MSDVTPLQIASTDAAYWADKLYSIRLQAGRFTFVDHEYQVEPMRSKVRRRCYMKATQGGFTQIEVLRSLHAMIFKHHPQGDLYMFPTADDVTDFSKSRFNPLIMANREAIGKYVKSGGKGTDTVVLKKIHEAFLYLRGTRLSQKISDVKESSRLRNIPVDAVKFDELDFMDIDVVAKARARMGHSLVQEEVFISNPLVPGEGIDMMFSASDQRHLFRKCGCGEWTCAELSFPACVKVREDGTGYIGCNKCGKEVPFNRGAQIEWVPSNRENSDYMHGYRWSKLTSVFHDPYEILTNFNDPPEGNLADVVRLDLGLPYIAAEDRLTMAEVYHCCGPDIPLHQYSGKSIMGVDVGKIKHVIIGIKTNKKQYQLLKTVAISKWEDIHALAKRFNVKNTVVDIRPYEDSAREFQVDAKKYHNKVWLCEYKENQPQEAIYNDHTGIVSVNRTEIFDATHRLVTTEGNLTIPRLSPDIQEFAKQICGAYKILEKNKRTGQMIYRYKGSDEHYRNALNYFLLAGRKSPVSERRAKRARQTHANNDYARI